MKNDIKQLTKESSDALIAAITSASIKNLIEKTKSANDTDSGNFKIIVSTADIDRQGESVNQNGWDLTFYKLNPIVLWAHDYASLPIGMATKIEVNDGKLIAEGKFAPAEANPFAQQVRKLYDLGMLNATSVGFIPKEYDGKKDGLITKSELLEFSFVPVPANPMALRLDEIKLNGIDTQLLKTKGLDISVKENVVISIEKKEEIANQLVDNEKRENKWENYEEVCKVIDAFCSVYFDEKTPVEDFKRLVGETASILQKIADGIIDVTEDTEKMLSGVDKLSIKDATMAVLRNHLALGSIKLSDGKEKEIIKENIITSSLDEVNVFVETRELLRGIDKVVEKALENFNKVARDRKL